METIIYLNSVNNYEVSILLPILYMGSQSSKFDPSRLVNAPFEQHGVVSMTSHIMTSAILYGSDLRLWSDSSSRRKNAIF